MTQFLDDDNNIVFEIDLAVPLIEWRGYVKKYRIVKSGYMSMTSCHSKEIRSLTKYKQYGMGMCRI